MELEQLFTLLHKCDFAAIPDNQSVNQIVKPGAYGPVVVHGDPKGTPLPFTLLENGMITQLNWVLENKRVINRYMGHESLLTLALRDLAQVQLCADPCPSAVGARFTLIRQLIKLRIGIRHPRDLPSIRRHLKLRIGVQHPRVLPLICDIKSMAEWQVDELLLAPALRQIALDATLPFDIFQRIIDCGHPYITAPHIIDDIVALHRDELMAQRPKFICNLIAKDPMCLRRLGSTGYMTPECLKYLLECGANPNVLNAVRCSTLAQILVAHPAFDLTHESVPMLLVNKLAITELTAVCRKLHQMNALDKTIGTDGFIARVLERFGHIQTLEAKTDLLLLFGVMFQAANHRDAVWDAMNEWCQMRVCISAIDMIQLSTLLTKLYRVDLLTDAQLTAIIHAQPAPYDSILHSLATLTMQLASPTEARRICTARNPYPLDATQPCIDYIGYEEVPLMETLAPGSPWFVFSTRPEATCCIDQDHFAEILFDEERWGYDEQMDTHTLKLWYFDIPIEQAFFAHMCGARCFYIEQIPESQSYELALAPRRPRE